MVLPFNNKPNNKQEIWKKRIKLIGLILCIPVALDTIIPAGDIFKKDAKLQVVGFHEKLEPEVQVRLHNKADSVVSLKRAELQLTVIGVIKEKARVATETKSQPNSKQPESESEDIWKKRLDIIALILGIFVAIFAIIQAYKGLKNVAKLEIVDFKIDNEKLYPEIQIRLRNTVSVAVLKKAELQFTGTKFIPERAEPAAEINPQLYDWLITSQDIEKGVSSYQLSRKLETNDADSLIFKVGFEKLHSQLEGNVRLRIYYNKNQKIDTQFSKIVITNYGGTIPKFLIPKDSRELLTQLQATNAVYTIQEIISELSKRKYEPAIPSIRKYFNHSEPEVRAAAAVYFSQVKDREVIPELAKAIKDNNLHVRRQASQALIFHAEESLDELEKLMNNSEPATRELVVNILSNINNQRSEMLLLKAIEDRGVAKVVSGEEVLVSASAIRAMAKIHSKLLSSKIVKLLNDDKLSVNIAALDATETLKLNEAIPELVKMLDSPKNRIRQKAHQVLVHLTGKDYGNLRENWIRQMNKN